MKEYSNRKLAAVYTALSEHRASRFFRDMTWPYAVWFFGWMIPALVAMLVQSITYVMICVFIGWIGAHRFRFGPGLTYIPSWFHGFMIMLRGNRVFTGARQAIRLMPTDFLGVIGTIYDPENNDDTAYIRVRGWQHVNADVFQRHSANLRLMTILRNVIAQLPGDIRISQMTRNRPFDPTQLAKDISDNILREDIVSATSGVNLKIRQYHERILQRSAAKRADYSGLYAVTVQRPADWRKIARHPEKFTTLQLIESPLMRVLDTLMDGLQHEGFDGVEHLQYDDVRRLIFRSWNLGSDDYVPGDNPWPKDGIKVDNHRHLLVMDGYYHRVLVTTQYGRPRVIASGFIDLMCGNAPWVGMTVCTSTSAKKMEAFILRQQRDTSQAFRNQYYKGGMIEDQESRDRRQAVIDKVDKLYLSGSKPTRTNRYFLVSGRSAEEVDEAERQLRIKLRRREITVVPVRGRARHLKSFVAAALAQEW